MSVTTFNAGAVEDTDLGYDQFMATFQGLRDAGVTVGVQDPGIAFYAAINEFGSSDGKVPERSFLRATFDANQRYYEARVRRGLIRVFDGELSLTDLLDEIGRGITRDILQTIDAQPLRNAPSTIAKKGFDYPLVETGALYASIRHEVFTAGATATSASGFSTADFVEAP